MKSDIPESDRYGLIGLVLGLKNKDIELATENLLKVNEFFVGAAWFPPHFSEMT